MARTWAKRRLWGGGRRSAPPGADAGEDEALFDEAFQRRLEYLAIVSRRVMSGRHRAERRTRKAGSGIEFADHRVYTPGDDFRTLDWNVYQRLGRLLVRLNEEEEDLSVYVVLDTSASMGFGDPPKLRHGKRLAAALAYVSLAHLDRVSVLTFADAMAGRLPPTRGKGRIFRVFDFLRDLRPGGETDLAASLRAFTAQNKRPGVVALVSDLYDAGGVAAGLDVLRYARFEPHVLHLVDARESALPALGDLRLVDAESGVAREVTVTESLHARFREAHAAWRREIEETCTAKHVPYYPLDVSVPFDEAVLGVLRRGGLFR